jgi:hypothetical protein
MKYSVEFEGEWEMIEPVAEHISELLYILNMADADDQDERIMSNLAGKPFETILKAWREIVLIQFEVKAGNNINWGSNANWTEDLKQDVWEELQNK